MNIKRVATGIVFLIVFACIVLISSGNDHLFKAIRSTYLIGKTGPSITDNNLFDHDTLKSSSSSFFDESMSKFSLTEVEVDKVKAWKTTSLLIIKNDSIIYENYWDGFDKKTISNSFSMAKSFTSLAIGAAIQDGFIKSVEDPVHLYLPSFTKEKRSLKIKHLLTMSSGIDFGESYGDPFGFMAKTYYGSELYELTINKPLIKKPGSEFHYQGGNTLLLSFIIEKATGKRFVDYFYERVWRKVGAENNALWGKTSNDQKTKSYCCFYSTARDFAKIGQLVLDSGKVGAEQIIGKQYLQKAVKPINVNDANGKLIDYYGYQWWLGEHSGFKYQYARGILGQYIVVVPAKNLVLIRLGHERDKTRNVKTPSDLFVYLDIIKNL